MTDSELPGLVPAPPKELPPAYPDRAAWGTATKLRAWQTAALEAYFTDNPKDFLAVATPGAGKTTFALTVAAELLSRRVVDRVTVVAPTEHLKTQWAEAAARAGIPIDPTYSGKKGQTSQDYVGVAVTYAGVAVNPLAHRIRTERFKTLVILDEVHHAGDAMSWGDAVREAFDPAQRRLALTGTPFRSDINPIPFVVLRARTPTASARSVADYTYGYAQALADHVVRPVLFMAYSGEMQWRTRAGDEIAARLGEPLTKDLTAQALRTALDPAGAWMPSVLAAADKRLTEVRRHVPDAGATGDRLRPGLRPGVRRAAARRSPASSRPSCCPTRRPPRSGSRPSPRATTGGWSRSGWSPRASTCPGWPSGSTPPAPPRRCSSPRPSAASCGPGGAARPRRCSCRRCRTCSASPPRWRSQRDHVLKRKVNDEGDIFAAEDELLAQANAAEAASAEELGTFEAMGSEARFDRVLYDGGEFGHEGEVHVGSDEEMDFLGIPGLLEADQVRDLLHSAAERARQAAAPDPLHARGRGPRRLDPRAAGHAAPRAQRPGRGVEPPHRPAARRHARGAAQGLRRAGRRRRDRRPAAEPDRPDP